ncbi:GNAT family N-acetyltransferase [Rhodobacterales bacterium HKCCE2091]|nr:GNAT family N-acetyltransferase [Rhodobacterales bacterium HKCCE2091]
MPPRDPAIPIELSPPLRPFRPEDAAVAAELNLAASGGLAEIAWRDMAAKTGETWQEVARRRQVERLDSGMLMVVAEGEAGAEAMLVGYPVPDEPEDPLEAPDVFRALVELENLVPGTWYLNILATVPAARRKGHGTLLLATADDIARAGGHAEISLIASDANPDALRLYDRAGYRERARRPMMKGSWDGPGENWLLLVKPL